MGPHSSLRNVFSPQRGWTRICTGNFMDWLLPRGSLRYRATTDRSSCGCVVATYVLLAVDIVKTFGAPLRTCVPARDVLPRRRSRRGPWDGASTHHQDPGERG